MREIQGARVVRFGQFVADLETGELWRSGRSVRLQARPSRILAALVATPGELVTRQSLRGLLWPEGVFVDFDHSLNASVRKLRAALGDDAGNPRFVETVGRRGYRFIAPVILDGQAEPGSRLQPPASTATSRSIMAGAASWHTQNASWPRRRAVRGLWVAAILMILAMVVVAVGKRRHAGASDGAITSIAVLPLHALNLETTEEYLGVGIADAVITRLSTLRQLTVRPTSTVRKYAAAAADPIAAGRDLGVDAVLEGSLQQVGRRIRVTARLLAVRDGRALWSGQLDEDVGDVLTLQDALATRAAVAVLSTLSQSDERKLHARDTSDARAYEAYLKGRYVLNKHPFDVYRTAIDFFEAAIAADANYARAYAGLADAYIFVAGDGDVSADQTIAKARAAAVRAIALDPLLGAPHRSLALIAENYEWDWLRAEREYVLAIAADPNDATTHHWYGEYLSLMGRFSEAIDELGRARSIDPLSLRLRRDTAMVYFFRREYDRAIEELRQALELDPTFDRGRGTLAMTYMTVGRIVDAEAELRKMGFSEDSPSMIGAFGQLAALQGRTREAHESAERLQRLTLDGRASPMDVAWVYLVLKEDESAIDWIERAVRIHDSPLTSLKVSPGYDRIRTHPRFVAILRRLGLDH